MPARVLVYDNGSSSTILMWSFDAEEAVNIGDYLASPPPVTTITTMTGLTSAKECSCVVSLS